ncbi:MAG TPA: iron ABC transporter permease [Tepidimicrobium sp.]|nr:iron ABC transporter permease [Tepidimicrobium sp.]
MENLSVKYYREGRKKKLIILGILFATIILSLYALNKGAAGILFWQTFQSLFGKGQDISNIVIWNIRLPRVIGGIVVGGGLAMAGTIMQTCLGNPLASPSILGISSAAAFGANIAIVFFNAGLVGNEAISINNPYIVTIFAFGFSTLAMFCILSIARLKSFSRESIILAGVAFNSLFTAGSTLIQYFAEDFQIAAMVFWTFGDLGRVSWKEVGILTTFCLLVFIFFMGKRWDFNALDSGEDSAISLGVDVDKIRFISMTLASLLTAVTVSFMGAIGFVGLIAPQMMRRIIGVDHRYLIPASAIMGSFILLFSDTLARTIISPIVLPVGAITSFFGAPLFLSLLIKGESRR